MARLSPCTLVGVVCWAWCHAPAPAGAVVPIAELSLSHGRGHLLAAPAAFSDTIPSKGRRVHLSLVRPKGLADGCSPEFTEEALALGSESLALLVRRSSNCTFGHRAAAAEALGASAIVVANSVEGMYRNHTYATAQQDYDCSNGAAWVHSLGDKLSGFPTSSCATDSRCSSHRCLLSGEQDETGRHRVCCAWDTYITMADSEMTSSGSIPAVYITMQDLDVLESATEVSSTSASTCALFLRPTVAVDIAAIIIWALGVATVALAAYRAGADEKESMQRERSNTRAVGSLGSHEAPREEDRLELTSQHALGFVILASAVLVLLFYVDLHVAITLLFCVSAVVCLSAVLVQPLVSKAAPRSMHRVVTVLPQLGPATAVDLVSYGASSTLAAVWFATRTSWSLAFVLQDLFGVCLCLLFLQIIRLPNLRVAAQLLSLAFAYDIFFVFISPAIFKQSVMVKVASGSGPTADEDFCEKYPSDADCQSWELPMLLLFPRVGDYLEGYTMLGLGDIVLPGLLVCFVARFDALIRASPPINSALMVFGYAVGLLLANVAVYWTGMGQPALLYLVPCTLGVLVAKTRLDGSFPRMWNAPVDDAQGGHGPRYGGGAASRAPSSHGASPPSGNGKNADMNSSNEGQPLLEGHYTPP